jgi:uncharacterized protein
MTRRGWWVVTAVGIVLFAAGYVVAVSVVPSVAAGGLLYPARRHVAEPPPPGCEDAVFAGEGVTLKGWRCQATGPRRGTIVYLHGVADNRTSIRGAVARFTGRGLDLVAYDSRAQGESTGTICTYGYWEKRDLKDVIDEVGAGPIVLVGASLGAAVALQEAPDDPRVVGVVAAESFSDLRTVARERAPRFLTQAMIRRAFVVVEARGDFHADEVSPVAAARRIRVPVLLIHGALDTDTPADHSRRILAALAGPKELILVEGAHHNESLRAEGTWQSLDNWVEGVLARNGRGAGHSDDDGDRR